MLRVLAALPVALATFTLAPYALASDVPKYAEIPVGRLTTMPTAKTPAIILARERVPGFFVAMAKFGAETPVRQRHIAVVGKQKDADSIRRGDGSGAQDLDVGTCFFESRMSNHGDEDDVEALEWSSGQMREVNLWPKAKGNEDAGIGAVHSERVVEGNGKVRLDSVDAWVDPATQGARLISRASLPLVLVGTAVGGVTVYAGRDEREAAGPKFVQFIIVRPGTAVTARSGSLVGMRQDGNVAQGNGCGHLRMALLVDAKNGDSAIVRVPIELSSLDTVAAKAQADAPTLEAPAPESTSKSKRRIKGKRKPPPPPAPNLVERAEREVRTRDVQLHLSVSQTTRDQEPVVAVSFGWANREAVQRITDDP